MKKNLLVIGLLILFVCLLSLTIYVSFSTNTTAQGILIKSIKPIYDETSTIEVDNENVIFNDKNQVVKYNVVLENTQVYDVQITDIQLSTPTEEFLDYKVEGISKGDVLGANSTEELTVSFETMGIKGWGRNFADELTANISFEKVVKQEEVTPPVEEDKEEEKQPEAPATKIEDIIDKAEKIEANSVTNNTIEFKDGFKVADVSKVETWIYPETEFYGYKEVDESNTIKEIVLEKERLDELEITPGEHNIVISTEEKEVLGYVDIYISADNEVLNEKLEFIDKDVVTGNNSDTSSKDEDGRVDNPYTSNSISITIICVITIVSGAVVIIIGKNRVAKYMVFVLMLSTTYNIATAEELFEIVIKNNVSFKSQNVMQTSYLLDEDDNKFFRGYWEYREKIKNFYIINEINEISEYVYKFDVTEANNGRVIAYLVSNKEDSSYYDLYLQADGIIYPNEDAYCYFYMSNLDKIYNLAGLDTSEVKIMKAMFADAGYNSDIFTLDLSSFNTANVVSMRSMFQKTGYNSENFTLNISSFDTRKVTDMSFMFNQIANNSTTFVLDVSNFDTSNVTDMRAMFTAVGYNNPNFTLDVSKFDTGKVTDMSFMFNRAGYSNTSFDLDIDNFDYNNVKDISYMFNKTGYNSSNFNIELTIQNPNLDIAASFVDTAIKTGSKVTINYTNKSKGVAQRAVNTKNDGANVVLGDMVEVISYDQVSIGDEVLIGNEYFNIVGQNDDTVTMLAQYNLGPDYRQSPTYNAVKFSDIVGWEYTPGPKEIDIQTWSTNPKEYINNYVEYLKEELNGSMVTGDLVSLKDMEKLGCTIPQDYDWVSDEVFRTCSNSPYKGWVYNGQKSWTKSAASNGSRRVWIMYVDYLFSYNTSDQKYAVRPVITISKETLKGL